MKNDLLALNNYLFEQIERITDDSVQGEELDEAIKKAEAVNNIAKTIVSNANVQLNAYREFGTVGDAGRVREALGITDGR